MASGNSFIEVRVMTIPRARPTILCRTRPTVRPTTRAREIVCLPISQVLRGAMSTWDSGSADVVRGWIEVGSLQLSVSDAFGNTSSAAGRTGGPGDII